MDAGRVPPTVSLDHAPSRLNATGFPPWRVHAAARVVSGSAPNGARLEADQLPLVYRALQVQSGGHLGHVRRGPWETTEHACMALNASASELRS